MRKHAPLAAALSVAAGALLAGAAPAAAADRPAPRCAAVATATTSVDAPVAVRLDCAGKVARLRLVDPPLHGVVDRVAARGRSLRYTPSPRWFSDAPDRFELVAETRRASDVVKVRVTVLPDAPECRDVAVRLTVRGHAAFRLPCGDLRSEPAFAIVERPEHGRARVNASTGRLAYTAARPRARRTDRLTYVVRNAGGASERHTVTLRPAATATAAPRQAPTGAEQEPQKAAVAPPVCATASAKTTYQRPVAVTVACTGDGVSLVPATEPTHGELANVTIEGGTLTATYTPAAGYDRRLGRETFSFLASNDGGEATAQVSVDVRPFRFVAFGDSVTAGFGYYADGSEMNEWAFLFGGCQPPDTTPVDGRCSSNSTLDRNAPGNGQPSYAADYGLANGVSWAAQFARRIPGGAVSATDGMYANYAVTGSSPGDWLAVDGDTRDATKPYPDGAGALTPQLDALLADEPDLVAFTLGANPVLTAMVKPTKSYAINCRWANSNDGWLPPTPILTWNQSLNCIQPHLGPGPNNVNLQGHLEALYGYLLTHTKNTRFVVMPYHLTVPDWLSIGWGWWQLEGAIDLLNNAIDTAVANVRARYPAQAGRLLHVTAQVDPNKPKATQLARFNYGGWSTRLGSPACVPANTACSPGDANDYGWSSNYGCSWFKHDVDGPSHQALVTQNQESGLSGSINCQGEPWIISADQGIHPNVAGYTQFAAALENALTAQGAMPTLPTVPAGG